MYIISFDRNKCVRCGNCEYILGDLHKRISFNKLEIQDEEYNSVRGLIDKTISKCFLDAITLIYEKGGSDECH